MAKKRLENTEKRLSRNPELYREYSATVNKYIEKGYVTKVNKKTHSENEQQWYIPHFPVLRPDKATTKVRIVFDASAKCEDVSLNDTNNAGPKLQRDLVDVLLRFRRHSVAIVCVIQEMYLQIEIPVSDRRFHRFLWRESPNLPPEEFEFNRLVFGVNASPFLAQYVTQQHALTFADRFPEASETVNRSTYMDDSMDSVTTDEKGIALYHDLADLWQKAGMFARKWLSNSQAVLEQIPKQNRAFEVDLSQGEFPSVKTICVLWVADKDKFTFMYNTPDKEMELTKRTFLKKLATVYDPLGFLSPYSIRAKMLMQDVRKWFDEMAELREIEVSRQLEFNEHQKSEIHTSVDASEKAYGTVVYARNTDNEVVKTISVIASKSKVAPMTSTSIPRLELMAAILGLRLTQRVCDALDCKISEASFWSDNMNVLWWIRNQSRLFKPFVANRLGEIHAVTNPEQWRYVPTGENPADFVSRGMTVHELKESEMWWRGPKFLQSSEENWPENRFEQSENGKVESQRGKWTPGRIPYYPGPDGLVRVADVKVGSSQKVFRRPTHRLCLLEEVPQ